MLVIRHRNKGIKHIFTVSNCFFFLIFPLLLLSFDSYTIFFRKKGEIQKKKMFARFIKSKFEKIALIQLLFHRLRPESSRYANKNAVFACK